jgi:hypothetical protein
VGQRSNSDVVDAAGRVDGETLMDGERMVKGRPGGRLPPGSGSQHSCIARSVPRSGGLATSVRSRGARSGTPFGERTLCTDRRFGAPRCDG